MSQIDYYGVALSPNIARNDQGYVIAKDAVLARTGYQDYRVSQLSKAQLRELGLLERFSDPDEIVQVYRSPEQVFSEATIASFEGMPVTDDHPKDFVTAENHAELQRGHVQNIRRGETPLSTGDYPLLGDVIITDPGLGDAVLEKRKRELSGGYNYSLAWNGNQLSQEQIIGNHVAVVRKGRAGAEARINDSADIPQPQRKQKMKIKDWFFGDGLKELAKADVEPKQIAAMARAFDEDDSPKEEKKEEPKAEEKKAEDADPLAEIKDSIKGIADGMKSVCDRLDKLENPESEEADDEELDEEPAEEAEADDEDEEAEGKGEDAFIEPAVSDSDIIKALRPIIARSKDAAIKKAFNRVIAKANDSVKGGTPAGAYGAAKAAAGKKSASALDSQDAQAAYYARLNERSQAAFNGQKEVVK